MFSQKHSLSQRDVTINDIFVTSYALASNKFQNKFVMTLGFYCVFALRFVHHFWLETSKQSKCANAGISKVSFKNERFIVQVLLIILLLPFIFHFILSTCKTKNTVEMSGMPSERLILSHSLQSDKKKPEKSLFHKQVNFVWPKSRKTCKNK